MRNAAIILLAVISLAVNAQTNVSGYILTNTTWTLAGSPYMVNGNTLVNNGATLTIEPGVVVKFDDSTAIQIDGELIAIGTAQSRITFTSKQAVPAPGDWGKIQFNNISTDAVFDSAGKYESGSIMKYCDILYGGELGYGALHIQFSAPYITHCNIRYSENDGIYFNGEAGKVDSSSIKYCAGKGLNFPNNRATCDWVIMNDSIEYNSSGGVFYNAALGICNPNVGRFDILNSVFISNGTDGAIKIGAADKEKLTISNNYFESNHGCIRMTFTTDYSIRCNRFVRNLSGGIVIDDGSFTYFKGVIANNVFDGNNSTVIKISASSSSILRVNEITNNLIKNNSSSNGAIFLLSTNMTFHINNNEFLNNSGLDCFQIQGGLVVDISRNNFLNNSVQYEINNLIPFGSANIQADNNYWGTTDTAHINTVIHDFFDYANLSVVYYFPILTSPATVDTSCSSITVCSMSVNGTTNSPTCYSVNNGSINITVTGGTAPYSYNWNNGASTEDLSNLAGGTYIVTVTDSSGCTASKSFTIIQPTELIASATSVTEHVTCYGSSDGAAKIIASGGTPPYSFLWSDGQTEDSPTNFPAGNYSVTVTDSLGCMAAASISIQDGPVVYVGVIIGFSTADINETSIYSVNAVFNYSYDWSVTNGSILTGQGTNSIEVAWDSIGQGIVQVIASEQGCGDTVSKTITLINTTGIHDAALNNIELYPNPTSGSITVQAAKVATVASLRLYDSIGKQLLQQDAMPNELQQGVVINMNEWNAGVFFLSIKTDEGTRVMKVVKY